MNNTKLELISTNLRRYTFESPKIKKWVSENCYGEVLNLFSGKTLLGFNEIRNDIDSSVNPDYNMDSLDFVINWKIDNPTFLFDTIIIDPPYSYRKSMEMYKGNYCSKFKRLADEIPKILNNNGNVISFGYHSTFLGKKRNFWLKKLCVFAHGGAQHCTIGIIETPIYKGNLNEG